MALFTLAWLVSISLAAATSVHKRLDGCGIEHNSGYNNNTANHLIDSGGYQRTYSVNVPPDYNSDTNKRRAVIVDYHGNGGDGYQQYLNSQYYLYDAGQEYLAIYPNGVNGSWQGPTYAIAGVDDLQFTTDLLAHLRTQYCIDDDRIYASGKSNGGGFVDLLACSDNGDEFAAFAMAAAALYTDTSEDSCSKRRAILESHGDEDVTIPYHPTKNGSGGPLPDISEWVTWWGHRTCGPDAQPEFSGDLGGYNTTTYSCGPWDKVVDHYQVFDLGHCWPSSTGTNYDALRSGQDTRKCLDKVLDYTQVVLDFFAKWNLRNAPTCDGADGTTMRRRTRKHSGTGQHSAAARFATPSFLPYWFGPSLLWSVVVLGW